MISQEVQLVLNIALKEAMRLKHEFVLTEHLLYSICFNESGALILQQCEVDVEKLAKKLESYLEHELKPVTDAENFNPTSSLAVERVVNRAVSQCLNSERHVCNIGDLLVSLMEEDECYSVMLLHDQEVDQLKMKESVTIEEERQEKSDKNKDGKKNANSQKKDEDFLKQFLVDLNAKARAKEIDPLIGRKKELADLLIVLARRKKNNPILVGDPGVGKTAIVEGLALAIEEKNIHPSFFGFHLYSLEVGSLLAGTKFRGDFEERIKRIFSLLEKNKKTIVFIDEIHTVVGAGSTGGSQLDISNLLKPFLSNSSIRFIGATTYQEYRQYFQKDHALSRRFEMVEVRELDSAQALTVIQRLKKAYENFHGVRYADASLSAIVDLSKRYLVTKKLPDSAIDLLDLSAATVKLEKTGEIAPLVRVKDIEVLVSKMTKVPVEKLGARQKEILKNLETEIKKEIFDQDEAVASVVKAIKLSRSKLAEEEKPIASLLFTGPTGVGKTELCRILAKQLNLELIRVDMSEYMEPHSTAKLIGAPPGYVGHGELGSQLTEKIKRYPYALLLLDEIEKAHRDVLNVFLQVMDYGMLTDSLGNRVSFTNVVIVMTSNAGAEEMISEGIGFLEETGISHRVNARINQFFSPEFRNRLTAIVHFNAITPRVAKQIVVKFLGELNKSISAKGIVVSLDDKAIGYLAKKGCDSKMGARPIKRLLDNEVKQKIVDDMLFGELSSGGEVRFSLAGDRLVKKIIRGGKSPANKEGKLPANKEEKSPAKPTKPTKPTKSVKVRKKTKRYEKLEEEAEV